MYDALVEYFLPDCTIVIKPFSDTTAKRKPLLVIIA